MGVDTEILMSYGILIPIEHGLYLEKLFGIYYYNDDKNQNDICEYDTDYIKKLGFVSDAYDERDNEMFIYLKSCKVTLFDRKTGGRSGRGSSAPSEIIINPTDEEKEEFKKFSDFVFEKIKNKFTTFDNLNNCCSYLFDDDYEPGVFVYYRNW
jgi:hypothetical protein